MNAPRVEEGVRYRSPLRRRIASADDIFNALDVMLEIALAVGGLLVVGTAVLLGIPLVWVIVGIAALVVAVFTVLIWIESRSSVTVAAEGIEVRNGLRTRNLSWAEIGRFEAGDGEGTAVLRSGSRIELRGIRDRLGFQHFWLIQQLNDRLASMQQAKESGFWGTPPP